MKVLTPLKGTDFKRRGADIMKKGPKDQRDVHSGMI